MDDSESPYGPDRERHWELESSGSSSTSESSSSTPTSVFSTPSTPGSTDTEMSFPSPGLNDDKQPLTPTQAGVIIMPNHPNHIVIGQKLYSPGHLRTMRELLSQARRTGEFPDTKSKAEDPQTIVEDYRHLQRLRDVRGDLTKPPPKEYTMLKVDIARRVKARDEDQGGSTNLQEMDTRVQGWMNSISKENRMLEITQAALQRKGISNPTQDDLDAIAEDFMQIAERTLLDVANPLRMNATRMAGNISRLDSQLDGFDGAMAAQLDGMNSQIHGLSSLNDAVNTSVAAQLNGLSSVSDSVNSQMTAQVNTLNTVLTNLQSNMTKTVGISAEAMNTAMTASTNTMSTAMTAAMNTSTTAMSTAMATQLGTLNSIMTAQSNTFNGSLNMLNSSLNTVTSDLHQLTATLPSMIAAAVQTAVQQQLAAASHQQTFNQQHHVGAEAPPRYAMNESAAYHQPLDSTPLPVYVQAIQQMQRAPTQHSCEASHLSKPRESKSRLRRFLRIITGRWGSTKRKSTKGSVLV